MRRPSTLLRHAVAVHRLRTHPVQASGVDGRAEAWIREQLRTASDALSRQAPNPGDLTLEQYEAQLRQRADAILRPTAQYVGLSLDAATAAASVTGDRLCVHRGSTEHRANWRPDRVHVELDAEDRVRLARRDPAPWTHAGST